MPTIGQLIKTKRKELGLSGQELAAAVKVSRQQVHYWEHDKDKPSATTLPRLAQALKCEVSYLLTGEALKAKIPLRGYAAAGGGCFTDIDLVEEMLEVPADEAGNFALRVSGESMEPAFVNNDVIFVEPLDIHLPKLEENEPFKVPIEKVRPYDNRIIIAEVEKLRYVKKLVVERKAGRDYRAHFTSLNPTHNPISVERTDEARILGVVYRLQRSM